MLLNYSSDPPGFIGSFSIGWRLWFWLSTHCINLLSWPWSFFGVVDGLVLLIFVAFFGVFKVTVGRTCVRTGSSRASIESRRRSHCLLLWVESGSSFVTRISYTKVAPFARLERISGFDKVRWTTWTYRPINIFKSIKLLWSDRRIRSTCIRIFILC